jgi:hypothetical protein
MLKRSAVAIALLSVTAGACRDAVEPLPADYREQVEAYRQTRENEIIGPTGWAALVGLHWLTPGVQTVGAAEENDVRLTGPSAPSSLGTLAVTAEMATLTASKDVQLSRGGQVVTTVELRAPGTAADYVAAGDTTLTMIRRGDRLALRVWDAKAPALLSLRGLEWLPVDPAWRVQGRFEAHPPGRTMKILNVLDELIEMPNPGIVTFRVAGQQYRLEALLESPDAKELFFLFRDGTSGKTTYGAGRYLYAPLPAAGRVILDFNKAKNPPCTFTDFATCPLPPKGNTLSLAVNAGELDRRH